MHGFLQTLDATYLAVVDRYSNWLSVLKLAKDDSSHLIAALRLYFSRWGVPKEITSDGASVFTSTAAKDFYDRWGVRHRVSSAYYARANKRSEVGVKSAKRLVMENLGAGGSLNSDKLARAMLAHHNTPDPVSGLSPSMIIFGRQLRDHLPSVIAKFKPRQKWRLEADIREKALATRHAKMEERLSYGAKPLPTLKVGDNVAVQDQQAGKGKAGKWTRSGRVVEILPHSSYMVVINGSRAPTQRNRRFLRLLTPFSPLIPSVPEYSHYSPPLTRAAAGRQSWEIAAPEDPATSTPDMAQAAPQPPLVAAPQHPPTATPQPPPVALFQATPPPAAQSHRLQPLAPPGQDVVTLLRQRETQGLHLAVQAAPWASYY